MSLSVTPANLSRAIGQQQQFTAIGNYKDGTHQNLTSSVGWMSSAPSVARFSGAGSSNNGVAGLATALAVGSTTVKATSGSINGSTGLTVTPPILVGGL